MPEQEDRDWQRLDKWLWCARFMRQRSDCARLVAEGVLRINRQRTEKPHARLRVGDVVTLPLRNRVLVVEVTALAARRGPTAEARGLFRELEPPGSPDPAESFTRPSGWAAPDRSSDCDPER